MASVLLVAASGLAREAIASMRQTGDHQVVGVLDDNPHLHGRQILGARVLGNIDLAAQSRDKFLVCAGSGSTRAALVSRLESMGVAPDRFATHVHESAVIGSGSTIGAGSIVLAGAVLTADVRVGRHVVLMPRVTLTHDDSVSDFATFAAGVSVGGRVAIGRYVYLGMNASVRQDVQVGEHAVLGMGAVLLRDLPAGQTWAGIPARAIGQAAKAPEMATPLGGNAS
jgi:sugar O-acyltransferase, sialic acid O-acetyltransferase NeuD family